MSPCPLALAVTTITPYQTPASDPPLSSEISHSLSQNPKRKFSQPAIFTSQSLSRCLTPVYNRCASLSQPYNYVPVVATSFVSVFDFSLLHVLCPASFSAACL